MREIAFGLLGGTLIGATGIGSGSLLTPLLILAGYRPTVAVSTGLATLRREQIRDRLQRRALARTVGAEQRDDRPLGNLQRHAFQHEDHVVVDDLDVVDRQVRRAGGGLFRRRG